MNIRNLTLHFVTFIFYLNTTVVMADQYTVQQVEDGDTLVIEIDGKPERIQLRGIDAPEDTRNPKLTRDIQRTELSEEALLNLGKQATEHLKSLITPGQQVRLTGDLTQRDKYGRISLIITNTNNHSINETMVADGYAIILKRQPLEEAFKSRLKQQEADAIAGKCGLWGEYREDAMSWSGR